MANDSLDFVQRGKVSIVRRQYAEAVKICRLGLLAHPTLLEGRLVLGMALTALGRWDEVLAEMRVALEVDPNNALAWLLKGEALVGKGDYASAEGTLKRAKELDPSNSKADQLLAEIQVARAAGFEGIPAEPTDTKVYPAKVQDGGDANVAEAARKLTAGGVADLPEGTGDHEVEYEEDPTEVDPDPSDRVPLDVQASRMRANDQAKTKPKPKVSRAAEALPKLTESPEKEDSSTELFLPPRGGMEASYEPPAADDYVERARPSVPSLSEDEQSSPGGSETRTPLEYRPHVGRPASRAVDGMPRGYAAGGAQVAASSPSDGTEPSIELSGVDLLDAESEQQFDLSDEEMEDTRQRRAKQVDPEAGTRPETPDPIVNRPKLRPFQAMNGNASSPIPDAVPVPRPGAKREPRMPSWGHNDGEDQPPGPSASGVREPGVVRVPGGTMRAPKIDGGMGGRLRYALFGERQGSGLALFVAGLIAVVAAGVLAGLFVREYRMRQRVAKRHDLARQKLQAGNYPGFQAAELLYRQILQERDDAQARALRARTLSQMSFEFGDPSDAAQRAVAALGDKDMTPEAQSARIYLAMSRGELEHAGKLATALRRKYTDALSSYLVGRAELLLERPESAADALRAAADKLPRDPLTLHALGLAEAAAGHDDRALDAYQRALDANANHIATLIDRAVLKVHQASPAVGATATAKEELEPVRSTLEGVVNKLAGDSSQGQLARAFLALGQLELARGDVEAARKALASAAAKRREGDFLFSEELAQALMRSFELDQAEKEARRAVTGFGGSGRLAPRLVLAEVALKRGRPAQALQTVEEAGTSKPEALALRAEAQLQLGRRESARSEAEAALRVQPDLVAAKVALARVDVADGHPERAQRELERLERGVKLSEVAEAMGEVFAGRFNERARAWFSEAVKRDPLNIDARLRLARLDREAGRVDDANAALQSILQLNPQHVPARRESAQLQLERGDAAAAREQFNLLAEQAADAETLMGAARAHLLAGDGAGAEERLKKAQALGMVGPLAEEIVDLTARATLQQHRPEEVVTLLKKLAPTAQRAETGGLLMQAYLDLDQADNAAKVPLYLPPRLRFQPEVLAQRARLQVERGRDVQAESLASDALLRLTPPRFAKNPPRDPSGARRWAKSEALIALGRSHYDQGSFKSALKALKSATDLDPTNARAFYHYAMVLDEVTRKPEAREAMETAVRIDPRYPEALYYLGRMRADANDPKAKEAFEKYLAVAAKGAYADEARQFIAGKARPPQPKKKGRAR